ncbi:MAG: Substrate-specific component BioY of biotin ECF transporter, partial [uncultured Rubrobacteraceae bacterium]
GCSRDDPGGSHGGLHRRGGPDLDTPRTRPVHVAGAGRRAGGPSARPPLRRSGDGGLRARRGRGRPGLRRLQGRARRPLRRHGRVLALVSSGRRRRGPRGPGRGQRAPPSGAHCRVLMGKRGAGRDLRSRRDLARRPRRPLPRRGPCGRRPAVHPLRPDKSRPRSPRCRRRRTRYRHVKGL